MDKYEAIPRYWTSGGQAEVYFIIQRGNDIIPIEVKADENINGRSLALYGQKYEVETKKRLRFSLRNLKQDGTLLNIPLFMIDCIAKLIEIAMGKKLLSVYRNWAFIFKNQMKGN